MALSESLAWGIRLQKTTVVGIRSLMVSENSREVDNQYSQMYERSLTQSVTTLLQPH